jgi:membrane dipeptidase
MKIIDSHCDLLSKMWMDPHIRFTDDQHDVAVSLPRMEQVNLALQFFAIYIPEHVKQIRFAHILECIDIFYRKIASNQRLVFIQDQEDLDEAVSNNKIGALLTLEGVDGLMGSMSNLRIAYYLGVRSMGITWNHANWAADGVMEPRNSGFTAQGKIFVKECNRLGILLDVSHLAETAFWQLVEMSSVPFIASHSNAFEICSHPRNLSNEQIAAVVLHKGMMGLTFVPWFVKPVQPQIKDLLLHIDHICSLGGENQIGFGSDFDGIETFIPNLEHTGHYSHLIEELLKHYSATQVEQFVYNNWLSFLKKNLHSKNRFLTD